MPLPTRRVVAFVKHIQHSLFTWFFLSYGTMYLISIFMTKNIYSRFEGDFYQIPSLQSLPKEAVRAYFQRVHGTEYFAQWIMFFSFICYLFIGYGGVRPITRFVKKMRSKKLDSQNFATGEPGELNHVRHIRRTIYEALLMKEKEEKELLAMQNTLLSQQKEAEIGKIVAQISHDLKSPLIIFEDLLRENSYENFQTHFDAAKRSLNKMLSLIYSLKQADKESLIQRSQAPLVVEQVLSECRAYAEKRKLHFHAYVDIGSQDLLLDHQKVERSINNLLRNAVEHAKSHVILNIGIRDQNLDVQIYDDGAGISPEVLPRLFQWRNTGNVASGTGIGLYYAKQIALAHGGDLVYEHDNGYTLFAMVIPGVLPQASSPAQTAGLQASEAPPPDTQTLAAFAEEPGKFVFFIQDKTIYDCFYSVFSRTSLPVAFFQEDCPLYRQTHALALYTDCSDILEGAMAQGIRILLHKQEDTPQEVMKRLKALYPHFDNPLTSTPH